MGGFECSTHINHAGHRLDMIAGVQHDSQAESDYALLRTEEMQTARDGLRWHLIDHGHGVYDFSSFAPMFAAAQRQNVQVIWDLLHYGWPDDLDLFSPAFVERFAKFSAAVARYVREHSDDIPFYAPVNEISFFSWAASRGVMFPYAEDRDAEIKRQMVRAAIASIEAIRAVDPRARFVFPEPTIHVVPETGHPEQQRAAAEYSNSQFEAWDMIAGFAQPELGGKPEYLDILGCNFYSPNEWQVSDGEKMQWDEVPRDPRWRPLNLLLKDVWDRYHRPLFIAETSHIGVGRGQWILEIAEEVRLALVNGVPIEGICLYPILDRFDWGDFHHWHNSGLWNLHLNERGVFERVIEKPYARDLRTARDLLKPFVSPA
jgi:beta-glucosidase/6-phospho-beta-glucosidase/beta-galactosidase